MEITRHFTATTFIVYKDKTLLHLHKTLNMWLPPGGHIDRDELPHIAALREIKEETGLDVELIHDEPSIKSENAVEIPGPRHLLLQNINPFHQHIDLIYYAKANTDIVVPDKGESIKLEWFNSEQLENNKVENDIRILGQEAIKLIS